MHKEDFLDGKSETQEGAHTGNVIMGLTDHSKDLALPRYVTHMWGAKESV